MNTDRYGEKYTFLKQSEYRYVELQCTLEISTKPYLHSFAIFILRLKKKMAKGANILKFPVLGCNILGKQHIYRV